MLGPYAPLRSVTTLCDLSNLPDLFDSDRRLYYSALKSSETVTHCSSAPLLTACVNERNSENGSLLGLNDCVPVVARDAGLDSPRVLDHD